MTDVDDKTPNKKISRPFEDRKPKSQMDNRSIHISKEPSDPTEPIQPVGPDAPNAPIAPVKPVEPT